MSHQVNTNNPCFFISIYILSGDMSWTWKGFWGDDPVYRFKDDNFFQSGRHKEVSNNVKDFIDLFSTG